MPTPLPIPDSSQDLFSFGAFPVESTSSAATFTMGLGSGVLPQSPEFNATEAPPSPTETAQALATSSRTTDTAAQTSVYDAAGNIVPTPGTAPIDLGSNTVLSYDPDTLAGRITPALAVSAQAQFANLADGGKQTFTGSDIRLMIEIADPLGPQRWSKQLVECTTITVSVFRVKDPARACGYIGAKGYSRGGRTVAGTLVLTQFTQDVLFEFLSAFALRDKSKDTSYAKIDQLPPFNITMIFTNESGYASFRRLLGVEFVSDGTVYSVNDAFSEETISYVCADFTTLMPMSLSSLMNPPSTTSASTSRERTVSDVMQPPADKTLLETMSV
jgi:hypothetical protein